MGSIPGSGGSSEESMATHSSILAWIIQWTEKSGRLQSIELQKVWQNWIDLAHMCAHTHTHTQTHTRTLCIHHGRVNHYKKKESWHVTLGKSLKLSGFCFCIYKAVNGICFFYFMSMLWVMYRKVFAHATTSYKCMRLISEPYKGRPDFINDFQCL